MHGFLRMTNSICKQVPKQCTVYSYSQSYNFYVPLNCLQTAVHRSIQLVGTCRGRGPHGQKQSAIVTASVFYIGARAPLTFGGQARAARPVTTDIRYKWELTYFYGSYSKCLWYLFKRFGAFPQVWFGSYRQMLFTCVQNYILTVCFS